LGSPILDLTLADGTRVTGPDHFINGSTTLRAEDHQGTDDAGFVSDEWQVTSRLRLDAGARLQYHHIEGSFRNTASTAGGTAVFLNTYTDQRANSHKVAATAGADYELTSRLGVWTRYSRGNIFPQFDTVQSGLVGTQTVDAFEGGVNYTAALLRLYGNVFYNKFRGIENFDLAANGARACCVTYTMLRQQRNPDIEAPPFPRSLWLIQGHQRLATQAAAQALRMGFPTGAVLAEGE
jgi:iron complex outermembrane receptor protein